MKNALKRREREREREVAKQITSATQQKEGRERREGGGNGEKKIERTVLVIDLDLIFISCTA